MKEGSLGAEEERWEMEKKGLEVEEGRWEKGDARERSEG